MLQTNLSANGYAVTTLSSGDGLVSMLSQNPCDLVIMDVGLHGTDGLTLMRKVREAGDDSTNAVATTVPDTGHGNV